MYPNYLINTAVASTAALDKTPHTTLSSRQKYLLLVDPDTLFVLVSIIPATVTTVGILGKAQMC
ncbi:MAG: hypothetical protein ACI9DH_000713 [Halioglobus sp.]|jgi:hypothetical protein